MNILKTLLDMMEGLPDVPYETYKGTDYITYLKEFRTVGLLCPRRCGKTKALQILVESRSFLLINKYRTHESAGYPASVLEDPESILCNFRGRSNMPKYRGILLDEFAIIPPSAYRMAQYLIAYNILETPPIFVGVGTLT